jgi:hypothetical protein
VFGVLAHFCRAMRRGENGQPNLRARARTTPWRRLKAAQTRTNDAPWVTRVLNRSSSSDVHGLDIRRISVAEEHRANRKDGRADPNQNGGFLLGNDWRRFHGEIIAMRSIGSDENLWIAFDFGPLLYRTNCPGLPSSGLGKGTFGWKSTGFIK